MKRNLIVLSALLMLGGAYTWYDDHAADTQSTAEAQQQQAPDFTFKALDGTTQRLSEFQGRPVVLNFWASWCAPCVVEFPAMLQLAAQEKDVAFLFLSLDESNDKIKAFLKKQARPSKNIFIARDEGAAISARLYKTYQLPETYLINSKGEIAEKIVGADIEWTSAETHRKIQSLR